MRARQRPGETGEERAEGVPCNQLTLAQSIGESAHRHHRFNGRGTRCVVGQHLGRELPDGVLLHVGVLELTEAVLQLLQIVDEGALPGRVVKCGEYLERVAQFLATLAKLVQLRRGRTRGDTDARLDDALERTRDGCLSDQLNRWPGRLRTPGIVDVVRLAPRSRAGPRTECTLCT